MSDYAYMSLSTEEFIRLTGAEQRNADLIRELRELRRYNVHRVPFSPHYAISADELDATLGRHEQEQR